jgi:flavodoxin
MLENAARCNFAPVKRRMNMKKLSYILAASLMALSAIACSKSDDDEADSQDQEEETLIEGSDSTILVAYFSWSGHTQNLAQTISSMTGGSLFRIEPKTPYTDDYQELAYTIARNEKANDTRPELADSDLDISGYEYIFVGCPVWWSDAPMIIHTFLEKYDFSGKTVIPFCTYASGAGGTLSDIVNATPNSSHLDGFGTSGSSISTSNVSSWLQRIGFNVNTD